MEGFLILDYLDRFPEAQADMLGWVLEGKVKHAVHVVEGLEEAPERAQPAVHRRQHRQGHRQGRRLRRVSGPAGTPDDLSRRATAPPIGRRRRAPPERCARIEPDEFGAYGRGDQPEVW